MNASTKMSKSASKSAAKTAAPRGSLRDARHQAVADARRGSVLAAARSAFIELGLEGASLREIARRAGYTPGALYRYFDSKEAVYAALLSESLDRLHAHVMPAAPAKAALPSPEAQLRRAATAFFDFYRENPRDLDLGFYLFQGMQPRGLTPQLNEPLNARLRDALAPVQQALLALGFAADEALTETTALFAHIAGLLLLSHTGRIRMFRRSSQALFARYLDQLAARRPVPARAARKAAR